jgi:hypothetical protein
MNPIVNSQSNISWNQFSNMYHVSTNTLSEGLLDAGILVPSGSDPSSTTSFTALFDIILSTGSGEEGSFMAFIQEGTTFSSPTPFDMTEFFFLELGTITGLPTNQEALFAVVFGADVDTTSNFPVQFNVRVADNLVGETLNIYHQSPGSGIWTLHGTCVVAMTYICTFEASTFSSFAITQTTESTPPTPSAGGSSSGSYTPQATTTTQTSSPVCIESAYNHDRLLKLGTKGSDVRNLQQVLVDYGYLDVIPDGDFGLLTKNAVAELQEKFSLDSDGIVGLKTGLVIELLAHCGVLAEDEVTPMTPAEDVDTVYQEALDLYEDVVSPEDQNIEPAPTELVVVQDEGKTCTIWWFMCWYWWIVVAAVIGVLVYGYRKNF